MQWLSKNILYQPTVKKHLSLLFIGYVLGILIYSFVNFNTLQNGKEFYLSGLLGILVLYSVVFSNSFLNRFVPFKKVPGIRILVGIIWTLILSFSLVFGSFLGYNKFHGYMVTQEQQTNLLIKLGILLFCASVLYNIIYFALYAYNNYARGQVMELKLERKQAELQLMTLKAQLSPHFLFNSMNALSALFQKDVEKAEIFIRALANSYQYTLSNYKTTLVSLKEELDFVNAYLFLIKTRFGDGVVVKVDLEDAILRSKIPPLTIQLLIENAVKHNVFDANRPLTINLKSEENSLIINNIKTEKKPQFGSTKIGLKNIISRYELITDKTVKVINDKDFTVKIPIIK